MGMYGDEQAYVSVDKSGTSLLFKNKAQVIKEMSECANTLKYELEQLGVEDIKFNILEFPC